MHAPSICGSCLAASGQELGKLWRKNIVYGFLVIFLFSLPLSVTVQAQDTGIKYSVWPGIATLTILCSYVYDT